MPGAAAQPPSRPADEAPLSVQHISPEKVAAGHASDAAGTTPPPPPLPAVAPPPHPCPHPHQQQHSLALPYGTHVNITIQQQHAPDPAAQQQGSSTGPRGQEEAASITSAPCTPSCEPAAAVAAAARDSPAAAAAKVCVDASTSPDMQPRYRTAEASAPGPDSLGDVREGQGSSLAIDMPAMPSSGPPPPTGHAGHACLHHGLSSTPRSHPHQSTGCHRNGREQVQPITIIIRFTLRAQHQPGGAWLTLPAPPAAPGQPRWRAHRVQGGGRAPGGSAPAGRRACG